MLGDFASANCLCQRNENRVPWPATIAGIELSFPPVQQMKRHSRIAYFVAQIIGNTTVGIYVKKVLAQAPRQKPRRDGEILIMTARQTPAIPTCFGFTRSDVGNRIFRRQVSPTA
jgi:hypothetical protein